MSYKHFTKDERLEISILLKKGYSHSDIAYAIGKNRSSISREISHNSVNGSYEPTKANQKAKRKRINSKRQGMKVNKHPLLVKYIEEKLHSKWTPEEIAGRWNSEKNIDSTGRTILVSYNAIYKWLYSSYGQRLCHLLPSKRYKRKPRRSVKTNKIRIPNRVPISERPEKINNRSEFGHLEGDTLGKPKRCPHTLVGITERVSRKVFFGKVFRLKNSINGFNDLLSPYRKIFKSLTLDNGRENVRHQELQIQTYFCHPYSSYEKGSIENSFKRLRRFIPKGTPIENFTPKRISSFADTMNNTPRKCLNWKTPNEVFDQFIT